MAHCFLLLIFFLLQLLMLLLLTFMLSCTSAKSQNSLPFPPRTHYRPKTPVKKEDSPSPRKISLNACDSPLPPSVLGDLEYQSQFGNSRGNSVSRSESRNSYTTAVNGGSGSSRRSQERRISNIRWGKFKKKTNVYLSCCSREGEIKLYQII